LLVNVIRLTLGYVLSLLTVVGEAELGSNMRLSSQQN
jgi:hypothetical protein